MRTAIAVLTGQPHCIAALLRGRRDAVARVPRPDARAVFCRPHTPALRPQCWPDEDAADPTHGIPRGIGTQTHRAVRQGAMYRSDGLAPRVAVLRHAEKRACRTPPLPTFPMKRKGPEPYTCRWYASNAAACASG